MSTVSVTTVGASWTMGGQHLGVGPWLGLIHECNRLTEGKMFGDPKIVDDDAGYREVYPDAEVRFYGEGAQDQLVTVASLNDDGARIIRTAAESMGLTIHEG